MTRATGLVVFALVLGNRIADYIMPENNVSLKTN